MTKEEIKEKALAYRRETAEYGETSVEGYARQIAYEAGADMLNKENEKLQKMLGKAIDMLKDIYEDDDYFCERLCDIQEEAKICAEHCG